MRKRIAASVVRDSMSDNIIIKLVSILPVNLNSTIDLKDFGVSGNIAEVTVLKGKPDQKNVVPEKFKLPVSDTLKAELPPYSFNVLRINTGETLTCNKGNTSFKIMLQDI